jgi:hypothetical protein
VGALYALQGVILEGRRLISILTQWTGIGLRYLILYGKQATVWIIGLNMVKRFSSTPKYLHPTSIFIDTRGFHQG